MIACGGVVPIETASGPLVATVALPGEPAPRCVCGDVMQKRVEAIPATAYLDFLRGEPVAQPTPAAEEKRTVMPAEKVLHIHRHKTPLVLRARFAWTFFGFGAVCRSQLVFGWFLRVACGHSRPLASIASGYRGCWVHARSSEFPARLSGFARG